MIDSREHFASLTDEPERLFAGLPTPCYVIDERALAANCRALAGVAERCGARMLLAQKAFANWALYPIMRPHLAGTEASGLYEARLGAEAMPGREVHVFCAAYSEAWFDELLRFADHIVFNSPRQLARFGRRAKDAGASVGLRVDPELSTQGDRAIYDPCAPGSRLGTTRAVMDEQMTPELLDLLDGLHFHTLCEQGADALDVTLAEFERKFDAEMRRMKWLNMGGGHHITKPGYDMALLESCVERAARRWGVQVYLEPGEAWALNAGYLVTRVQDVVTSSGVMTAIVDASAACHAPDVIEMPYRPPLYGDAEHGVSFRIGGPTCLAGDLFGEYALARAPQEDDLLVFGDMAIYTTVKNNTFNGTPLPPIYAMREDGTFDLLASFSYEDFALRLSRR